MKKILVLFCILFHLTGHAYRFAITKARQTVVYADVDLAAPIGYIRSGRKLKVGDTTLKQGSIVPLIVSGKIAYVKTSDISFTISGSKLEHRTPELTEHEIDKIFKSDAEKLKENSYLSLDYMRVSPGSDWQDFHEKYSNTDAPAFNRINLAIEYRDPKSRNGFKLGLGYLFGSSENTKITSIYGDFQYQFRIINRSSFALEAYAGLIITGDFTQENFGEKSAGGAWGYNAGGRVRIAPFSALGFYAQAAIVSYNSYSMDEIVTETVSSVGGVSLGVGISYRL